MNKSRFLSPFLLLLFAGTSPATFAQGADSSHLKMLINEGRRHYYHHQYREAIDQYYKALELAPQNPESLYELAWAWFELQEYPNSLEAATQGTLYTSGKLMDQLYALISMNYYHTMNVAVYELELSNKTEEEVKFFKKMARTAEDGDERLFKLGMTYTTRNQPEAASIAFVEALQLHPDYPECHWELAKALDGQGRYSLATMAYAQSVLTSPNGVFTDRILTMLENCLLRSRGDSTTVHINSLGNPSALAHEIEAFIAKQEANSAADTAVVRYYLPWYRELKEKGYLEVFTNYLYSVDDNAQAREWIAKNQDRLQSFTEWRNRFQWYKTDSAEGQESSSAADRH